MSHYNQHTSPNVPAPSNLTRPLRNGELIVATGATTLALYYVATWTVGILTLLG